VSDSEDDVDNEKGNSPGKEVTELGNDEGHEVLPDNSRGCCGWKVYRLFRIYPVDRLTEATLLNQPPRQVSQRALVAMVIVLQNSLHRCV
jgi:hypothetical protein